MLSTLLLSGLTGFAAGTPTPHKRQDAANFQMSFGTTMIPIGTSEDGLRNAFQRAKEVCNFSSCAPGTSVTVDVGVHYSGGAYQQMESAPLTISFEGSYDTMGEDDTKIRDALVETIMQAALQTATTETVTIQKGPGSSGPSCEKNPAACKDPEYVDHDFWSVPNAIQVIARNQGSEIGALTATLSIDMPELNLGPFSCENAAAGLSLIPNPITEVLGSFGGAACSLIG